MIPVRELKVDSGSGDDRSIDWVVLFTALGGFVLYGLWRSRGERNLKDYLLAGQSMPWPAVALTVMATQASATKS